LLSFLHQRLTFFTNGYEYTPVFYDGILPPPEQTPHCFQLSNTANSKITPIHPLCCSSYRAKIDDIRQNAHQMSQKTPPLLHHFTSLNKNIKIYILYIAHFAVL